MRACCAPCWDTPATFGAKMTADHRSGQLCGSVKCDAWQEVALIDSGFARRNTNTQTGSAAT